MDNLPNANCPAVPRPCSGTAGQAAPATDNSGTTGGTGSGTPSLKALAKLVIERDKQRDNGRDNPPDTAPDPCHRLRDSAETQRDIGPAAGTCHLWIGWI